MVLNGKMKMRARWQRLPHFYVLFFGAEKDQKAAAGLRSIKNKIFLFRL